MGWFSRRYYRLWFFFEKFTRDPPQSAVKKSNSMKSCFYSLLISQIEFYYLLSGVEIYFHDKNAISLNLIFWPHPEGDHGWIFRIESKSIITHGNHTILPSFFELIQNISLVSMKILTLTIKIGEVPGKNHSNQGFSSVFLGYLCLTYVFFLDTFIPFCSFSKGLSTGI